MANLRRLDVCGRIALIRLRSPLPLTIHECNWKWSAIEDGCVRGKTQHLPS